MKDNPAVKKVYENIFTSLGSVLRENGSLRMKIRTPAYRAANCHLLKCPTMPPGGIVAPYPHLIGIDLFDEIYGQLSAVSTKWIRMASAEDDDRRDNLV